MRAPRSRFLSALVAFLLVFSLSPAAAFAQPSATASNSRAENSSPSSESAPAQSEVSSTKLGFAKTVDPDTSSAWKSLFGEDGGSNSSSADGSAAPYSTENAGRIWADKSVYASAEEAHAAGIDGAMLSNKDYGFIVGLSAFSSAVSIRTESTVPHDVVFVVSLNSTMGSFVYDGKTYAEHLADALNEAIGRLMQENNSGTKGTTRVAVVGYNIDTTVLMPLDAYTPDADGAYVRFTRSLASGGSGLEVCALPESTTTRTNDGRLAGCAYLQRGIHTGANILVEALDEEGSGEQRQPVLVVMGTETPETANTNIVDPPAYADANAEANGFVGTMPATHNARFGTDAALSTLLTMQYDKQRLANAAECIGQEFNLYTVGLDTSSLGAYVLQTAQGQAGMNVVDTINGSEVDLVENLNHARRTYAEAAAGQDTSVTLDLYGSGSGGLKAVETTFPNPVEHLLSDSDDYAFTAVDEYFLATDGGALSGAFGAAVDRMLDIEYSSPIDERVRNAADSSDRFRAEDKIGSLMTVARIEGIQFQGRLLDGSLAAKAVTASFADPWDVESYHEVNYLMNALNARYDLGWGAYNLLYEAFADGQFAYRADGTWSNCASWFVNENHKMVDSDGQGYTFANSEVVKAVESGNWEDGPGQTHETITAAQKAGATAVCQTYFYIGNLENQYTGADVPLYDFVVMVETSLETGEQTVLFTVPADSIPARKAYVTKRGDGTATLELDEGDGDLQPLRLVYEVAPRDDVAALLDRMAAGEEVSDNEMNAVFGNSINADADGSRLLYTNAFDAGGSGGESQTMPLTAASAVVAPTNSYYLFAKDTPLFTLTDATSAPAETGPSADDLEPLKENPTPGCTYYYAVTYYTATGASSSSPVPAQEVQAYRPFTAPSADAGVGDIYAKDAHGTVVVKAGTPKYPVPSELQTVPKSENATSTAPFSSQSSLANNAATDTALLSVKLGNNGTLQVPSSHESGSITIKKLVEGNAVGSIDDPAPAFPFTLKLTSKTGAPLTGSFPFSFSDAQGNTASGMATVSEDGTVTFSNGSTLALAHGQSLTFAGIPVGTSYTVQESDAEGYDVSWTKASTATESANADNGTSGTVAEMTGSLTQDGQVDTLTCMNAQWAYGDLSISKQVVGEENAGEKEFSFAVTLTDSAGKPVSGSFEMKTTTDPDSGMRASEQAIFDENGSCTVKVKAGNTLTFSGIPQGTHYSVVEDAGSSEGYLVKRADDEGIIGATASEARFDNVKASGALGIAKIVTGNAGDYERGYAFAATVDGLFQTGSEAERSLDATLFKADGTQEAQTITFTRTNSGADDAQSTVGTATFTLSHNQGLLLEGLPSGSSYTVQETDFDELVDDGYRVFAGTDSDFASPGNGESTDGIYRGTLPASDDTAVGVYFVNEKNEQGSLSVTKEVNGAAALDDAASGREFAFMAYAQDTNGTPLSGSYPARITNEAGETPPQDNGRTVVFDNGLASFSLTAGQTITIEGLPATTRYNVAEQSLKLDGYETTSENETGIITSGQNTSARFVNTKEYAPATLSLVGTVTTDAHAQSAGEFTFTALTEDGSPALGADGMPLEAVNSSSPVGTAASFNLGTLAFDHPGTYTYTVQEQFAPNAAHEDGIVLDTATHTVTVEVSAQEDGTLAVSSVAYRTGDKDANSLAFHNTFQSTDNNAAVLEGLTVSKTLSGRAWNPDDLFAFTIVPATARTPEGDAIPDGAPLPNETTVSIGGFDAARQGHADDGGAVVRQLEDIVFNQPGTYSYVLYELLDESGASSSTNYSSSLWALSVAVSAQPDGTLCADPKLYRLTADNGTPVDRAVPEDGLTATFANSVNTAAVHAALNGSVDLTGASGACQLSDSMFAFRVQAVGDNATNAPRPTVAEARNVGELFTFGSLAFEDAQSKVGQTFAYEVSQVIPDGAVWSADGLTAEKDGIVYDARTQTILVHLVQENTAQGPQPTALVEYPLQDGEEENRVAFHNQCAKENPGVDPAPDPDPDPNPDPDPDPTPDPEPSPDPDPVPDPDPSPTPEPDPGQNPDSDNPQNPSTQPKPENGNNGKPGSGATAAKDKQETDNPSKARADAKQSAVAEKSKSGSTLVQTGDPLGGVIAALVIAAAIAVIALLKTARKR